MQRLPAIISVQGGGWVVARVETGGIEIVVSNKGEVGDQDLQGVNQSEVEGQELQFDYRPFERPGRSTPDATCEDVFW